MLASRQSTNPAAGAPLVTSRPESSAFPDIECEWFFALAWPLLFLFSRTPSEETGLQGRRRLLPGANKGKRRRMEVRHDAC